MSVTSEQANRELRVMFSKRRNSGLVLGLSIPQVAVLVIAGFMVVLALQEGVRGPFAVALWIGAPLVAVAGLIRPWGRPLADFIPSLVGEAAMRVAGERRYRGGPVRAQHLDEDAEPGAQLPGSLSTLSFESYSVGSSEDVGMMRDRQDGTVTGVLQVAGETFSLLSASERAIRAQALQRWLDSMAQPESPVVAVQWLTIVLPDDGDEVYRQWRTRRLDDGNAFASAIYDEALARDTRGGWTHEAYVAIRIDPSRNRAVRAAVKAHGGRELGALALLWQWMSQASTDLQDAGVRVLGWVPARGVAAVVRRAFDPDSAAMIARRGGGAGDIAGGDAGLPSGVDPFMCGPTHAQTRMGHYEHENYLTRTWWVTEWPRHQQGVPVGFLQPLVLEADCWHTISVTLTPLPGRRAQRAIDLQASTQDAKKRTDERLKRRRRRSDEREETDVRRREDELVDGYSSWQVTGLVSCTAPDESRLLAAGSNLASAFHRSGVEAQVWYVEQDQAMWCAALPLARVPS